MAQLTNDQLELLELLEEAERRKKYNKLEAVFPETGPLRRELYTHAMKFFEAGAKFRDRCFIGGNRSGKTFSLAIETTYHLTGRYPKWWKGKRFNEPTKVWAAGITNKTVKNIIQTGLFGSFLDLGSGTIPKDDIVKIVTKAGVSEGIETAYIKHYDSFGIEDGVSKIDLLSYDQGPDKFQGESIHFIWLDEEPANAKIKDECMMRTMKTGDFPGGIMALSFTPLLGLSTVVLNYLPGGRCPIDHVNPATNSWAIQVSWDDVPHLTKEEKEELMMAIPPWMRDARMRGIPQIGAGAIYPVAEGDISVEPFQIPAYWPRAYALDVGWHKTAAVWGAQDPATGVWYIYSEHYAGRDEPPLHAQAIKTRGAWIPGVIDPASNRSRDDGTRLLRQYLDLGLDLCMASNALEAGLSLVWQMLSCGQLKVFSTCQNWFNEFRTYHKDDNGRIPDGQPDHLMDSTRYLCMSGLNVAMTDPGTEDEYQSASENTAQYLGAAKTTGY